MNSQLQSEKQILAKARTLAQLLDVSVRQIGYWAESGVLRPIRLGDRCVRFDVNECVERLKKIQG